MISHVEQYWTDRIHAWGKPHYTFWYAVAVHLMDIFVVAWVIFGFLGWLPWRQLPLMGFSAWILTLVTQAIIRRDRPNFEKTTGYTMWWRTYSAPSGHSLISMACAVGTLMLTHFPSPLALVMTGGVLAIAVVLIGLSRVVVGVHYVGDVILGFVLGAVFGVVYSLL